MENNNESNLSYDEIPLRMPTINSEGITDYFVNMLKTYYTRLDKDMLLTYII